MAKLFSPLQNQACHLQRFTSVHDQMANLFMHCLYNANA
jgi:putative transposase